LFRSKEFMRNETELVIIATPYLVKPVARNELVRPDDNFNAPSDGAGFFLGRVNRVYGQMETELPPGRYHGASRLYLQMIRNHINVEQHSSSRNS
jgi:pilus assembly protein CpaC